MAVHSPSTVRAVDDAGVHLNPDEDTVVDVLFDGRRIWSFWTVRDTSDGIAEWPRMLRRFLHGTTRVTVVEHLTGSPLFEADVSLGQGEGRIAVIDAQGRPLGLDKSNRIVTTFDTRDAEHTAPLLDSTERVLGELTAAVMWAARRAAASDPTRRAVSRRR